MVPRHFLRLFRGGRAGFPLLASAALACVLLILNTGCEKKSGNKVIQIRMAHGLPTTHPVHLAMEYMAAQLEEKSSGSMIIEIYPGEQLGTERDVLEQLQLGAVELTKVSCAVMESFAPEYRVLSLPYIFRDDEHYWSVLTGSIGREILESGDARSLRGLCFYDAGWRSFYTIDRPIITPADLAGLKIRVQESPTAKELVNTLGGSATPIPWGELYGALQQGVVDGAENNPPSFYLSGHYEVARYYTLNQHTAVPDVVLVSSHFWNKLNEEQRIWLQEAADASAVHQRTLWAESSADALSKVKADGVTVTNPDRDVFADAVKPMLDRVRRDDPLVDDFLTRIAESK